MYTLKQKMSLQDKSSLLASIAETNDFSTINKGKYLDISVGVYGIPKAERNPYNKGNLCTPLDCGEDSYWISETYDKEIVLGVADGVSSWCDIGINPALFAQTLMQNVSEIAETSSNQVDHRSLLCAAYTKLVENSRIDDKKPKPYGSSTANIMMINKLTGKLRFANLGDSVFMILCPGIQFIELNINQYLNNTVLIFLIN